MMSRDSAESMRATPLAAGIAFSPDSSYHTSDFGADGMSAYSGQVLQTTMLLPVLVHVPLESQRKSVAAMCIE